MCATVSGFLKLHEDTIIALLGREDHKEMGLHSLKQAFSLVSLFFATSLKPYEQRQRCHGAT
jgi:hypothetical protein